METTEKIEVKKSFWQTVLGTIRGIDNEGSAKRASTFYLMCVVMTMLTGTYCYGYIKAVDSPSPTVVHIAVVGAFLTFVGFVLLAATTWLGFATMELITSITRKFTGAPVTIQKDELTVKKETTEQVN